MFEIWMGENEDHFPWDFTKFSIVFPILKQTNLHLCLLFFLGILLADHANENVHHEDGEEQHPSRRNWLIPSGSEQ